MIKLSGFIKECQHDENYRALMLSSDEIPLASRLWDIANKQVSVRYYLSDKETSFEDAQTRFVEKLLGKIEVEYRDNYSEYTGYLWTDENLKVGGHDLMAELRNNVGKFLNLEIEVHEQ